MFLVVALREIFCATDKFTKTCTPRILSRKKSPSMGGRYTSVSVVKFDFLDVVLVLIPTTSIPQYLEDGM